MAQKRKKFVNENRSTRDIILDLVEQEIALHGVEGLRLKNVADQVGVQLPSIYAHFSGRKEVLEALGDRLMDELLEIYHGLDGLPPREALLASADRTIDFYIANRGYARLVLADFPAPYNHSIFTRSSHKITEVLSVVQKSIEQGVKDKTVRPMRADVFLSFRLGVTLFPLFMRSDTGIKEMVTDPKIIDEIKRESHRILAMYISVPTQN